MDCTNLVSIGQASSLLGVSVATLKNWVKAGYIAPVIVDPMSFTESSVIHLKSELPSVEPSRLRSRANKSWSGEMLLPTEYSNDPGVAGQIAKAAAFINENNIPISPVLFFAAMRMLEKSGEIGKIEDDVVLNPDSIVEWSRYAIKSAMLDWKRSFDYTFDSSHLDVLSRLLIPSLVGDYLGLLYQSISTVGNKSRIGSYYTPPKLVADAMDAIDCPVESFLDPCCGSGNYLLSAAAKFGLNPSSIFGFDCDETATRIAKINLLLAFKGVEFVPNVYCLDSLSDLATGDLLCGTNDLVDSIDLVASNPPWGAYKNLPHRGLHSEKIVSGESFSLFIEKSLKLLRPGGRLSFILPESILKVKAHADVRELILSETSIVCIQVIGRVFTGVFTPVIRLDLMKRRAPSNWLVCVGSNSEVNFLKQHRFCRNKRSEFNISIKSSEEPLVEKIYAVEHTTLTNQAEWALGIVTGNNKKHLSSTMLDGFEPVYRGSDVYPYSLKPPKSYIRFVPSDFQQVAPERLYRAPEKLIYKFISRRLVFAYDNQQRLTLNSANILIPYISRLNIKVVLALLNSSVFQYIFIKKFDTIKVLRGDLEQLPFPVLDEITQNKILLLQEDAHLNGESAMRLDRLIFDVFQLDDNEIHAITSVS